MSESDLRGGPDRAGVNVCVCVGVCVGGLLCGCGWGESGKSAGLGRGA
jgi:hypothetical protein